MFFLTSFIIVYFQLQISFLLIILQFKGVLLYTFYFTNQAKNCNIEECLYYYKTSQYVSQIIKMLIFANISFIFLKERRKCLKKLLDSEERMYETELSRKGLCIIKNWIMICCAMDLKCFYCKIVTNSKLWRVKDWKNKVNIYNFY